MEADWQYHIFLLVIFIFFSAFFSGAEVALFSLDKKKLNELSDKGLTGRYIILLLEYPKRLLVTILLGNTIINVGASIVAVSLALQISYSTGWDKELLLGAQIVLLTIVILIFGEVTPKIWASKYPVQFAKIISVPLYWINVILYPISKVISDLIKLVFKSFKNDNKKTAIQVTDLAELADIGFEKGTIEEDEQELIQGLVSFRSVTAREVMTPRVDLTAVPLETSLTTLMSIINDSGHSRIPLYQDNIDNILGVIYAKDLISIIKDYETQKPFDLKLIARKAMFIPETKLISELLHEFQIKKMHVGIVVDEYGGTAGLISLEDILEEIVGDIRDEYDKEEIEITKINEHTYIMLGKVSVDEVNETFSDSVISESDDYDTLGGFILQQAGSIPEQNYKFSSGDFTFTVKEVREKRILKVLVEKN